MDGTSDTEDDKPRPRRSRDGWNRLRHDVSRDKAKRAPAQVKRRRGGVFEGEDADPTSKPKTPEQQQAQRAVGSGAMAAAALRDAIDSLKDDEDESLWPQPEVNEATREVDRRQEELQQLIKETEALERERAARAAQELTKEQNESLKVMQRFARRWLRKHKGQQMPDMLGMVRGFIQRRRSLLLKIAGAATQFADTDDDQKNAVSKLKEAFGKESLAGAKPQQVEEYMEVHELEKFITSALQEIINETFVPANVFPTLMVRMRKKYTAEVEYVKTSDGELINKYYKNLQNIKDYDLDGRPLAASYFSHIDPKLTFWGDKNIMRAIEAESLLPLRRAIGQYLESKVITSPRGKMIVGRALVGRTIYHQSTSPFPSSMEMADECVGFGSDLEGLVEMFAEHVISDQEEIISTGVHSLLTPFKVGIATPEGQYQRFSDWTLNDLRQKRKAFVAELSNSTVNKRANRIDVLFRVKMREVPGATDVEAEQAQGGWGFISCRKYYGFYYRPDNEREPYRVYVEQPFKSLYRGIFFEKDAANLYAGKHLPGGEGGPGGTITPKLLKPFLDISDDALVEADYEGDALLVAEMALAPALLREALGTPMEQGLMAKAQRLRGSGAHVLRTLVDHMFAMEKALNLVHLAAKKGELYDRDEMVSTVDPYRAAGVSSTGLEDVMATPLGDGQTFDVATSARVTMGQLQWINREIGQLVGKCEGGIELDAMSDLILKRMGALVNKWVLNQKINPDQVKRDLKWLRDLCKSCYMSFATAISAPNPIVVRRSVPLESVRRFEKAVIKDLIPMELAIKNAVRTFKVPREVARESLQLQYAVDIGMDTFFEDALRHLTDDRLFPVPKMRAMRLLRKHSQFFLLWKAHDLDILDALARMDEFILPCKSEQARKRFVFYSRGNRPQPTKLGRQPPAVPQPGLWCPPDTGETEPAYGTTVALRSWFTWVAGGGEGPELLMRGGRQSSSGSGSQGGVHYNTGYDPKWWFQAHKDIKGIVTGLRNNLPVQSKGYTVEVAMAVRTALVHPVPFSPVLHIRFPRLTLYEYYMVEGPKRYRGIEVACNHFLNHIVHLHDVTDHIPMGVYIDPEKPRTDENGKPVSVSAAGFGGDIQNLEIPGATHQVWSPAQIKQRKELVVQAVRAAVEERRAVYSVGLYWLKDPKEGKEKEKLGNDDEEAVGGYVLWLCLFNLAYGPSSPLQLEQRDALYHERVRWWIHDQHAMYNNVFFSEREALMVQQLYPLYDLDADPCGPVNAAEHLNGLIRAMEEDSSVGDYMDIIFSVWQRAVLRSYQDNLRELMKAQEASAASAKQVFESGRHYVNWRFGLRYPDLSAMAEAYRLLHSSAQQMICLQHSLIALATILECKAPEVRIKVRLPALQVQARQIKQKLLACLMEEANKIYMHGLHRSLYNRTTLIVNTVESIYSQPLAYASEVDAALPSGETSQIVPKLEDVGMKASGVVKGALAAMVDLQIYLTSIVQVVGATTYENCEMIKIVIRRDDKEIAEQNRMRMLESSKSPAPKAKEKGIDWKHRDALQHLPTN